MGKEQEISIYISRREHQVYTIDIESTKRHACQRGNPAG